MVAEEKPETTKGTKAGFVDSFVTPLCVSQHFKKGWPHFEPAKGATAQATVKTIQQNPRVQGKSYASKIKIRQPIITSPRRRTTMLPTLSSRKYLEPKNNESGMSSTIFIESPRGNSVTNASLSSQRTRSTITTLPLASSLTTESVITRKTATTSTSTTSTNKSDLLPSLISFASTTSSDSLPTTQLSKIRAKISGSIRPISSTTPTSTELKVPKITRTTQRLNPVKRTSEKSLGLKPLTSSTMELASHRFDSRKILKPKVVTGSLHPRAPKKVTAIPLKAAENSRAIEGVPLPANNPRNSDKRRTPAAKKGNKNSKGKKKPSTPSETKKSGTINNEPKKSKGSPLSKSSRGSKGKRKKAKTGKEKVKKLNRRVVYKELKAIEKKMADEAKRRKKMEWEKNKLYFYWNSVVTRLLDLQRRNHALKKKESSLKMEKKDGICHQNWRTMNLTRLQREECLDQKRAEFRSMIRELRDSNKRQTDWLFKDIQTYVKDTYLIGQKYLNDVVGIRMEYTKGLTDKMFDARENLRVLEIEQNAKYCPALEEFEEQMRKLRSKIPTERQDRLQKMLAESNGMLVELVNVYTTILHHNFIEVCHTANIVNQLKGVERRLEREYGDIVKKRDKIKERTEYLHDRISSLRRQVNSGKEARKKLLRVMKDQEALNNKIDLAYINKEIMYQENSRLTEALQEMSERVDKWYFKVKRDFMKSIIIETEKHQERASQLTNYSNLARFLFNVESDFLESIENFKDHEEFYDQQEGLKVLLGVYRPNTVHDLEREFEGCTESFTTAIIFFKHRLQQNYMSLDDLHFFIRRRNPLSYLNKVREEESELKQLMAFIHGSRYGHVRYPQTGFTGPTPSSSQSFRW